MVMKYVKERSIHAACTAIAIAASGLCAASAWADSVSHGKALVETNCARCHAVGKTDKSTHPDAPAFRTLSQRYPIADLEEALAEGISTGHPDMPEWVASPEQIDAILAYIQSLQKQ
ncbi:c-type cytochrome [Mesorhizobium sp.]|uniref:c-type cytochrome n=1 Tax=Mesorhizobium sp. TaxID=1871066 RepID=UPI003BA96568